MNIDQERWSRVKDRLRFELGEDIFSSWFVRMEFESLDKEAIRLSVPTRFLRKWIQSHYADRVLAQWQVEEPAITRLELSVRSSTIAPVPKPKAVEVPALTREPRDLTAPNGEGSRLPFISMHDTLAG